MKYQLAMDILPFEDAVAIARNMVGLADIIEIGTPLLLKEGLKAVEKMKEAVPELLVLADAKIMDAGTIEANDVFNAGADIVTVCALAEDATVTGVIETAKKHNKLTLIDMIAVTNPVLRAKEIDDMKPDYIQVHTAFDGRGVKNPLNTMRAVKPVLTYADLAVAGGVGADIIKEIASEKPGIVVIGSKVLGKPNPVEHMMQLVKLAKQHIHS